MKKTFTHKGHSFEITVKFNQKESQHLVEIYCAHVTSFPYAMHRYCSSDDLEEVVTTLESNARESINNREYSKEIALLEKLGFEPIS